MPPRDYGKTPAGASLHAVALHTVDRTLIGRLFAAAAPGGGNLSEAKADTHKLDVSVEVQWPSSLPGLDWSADWDSSHESDTTEDGTMQDSGGGEIIMSGGAWPADTDPMIISWERGDFAGSEYFSGSEYSSGSESISGDEYEASYTSKDEPGMMSAAADRPRRRGSARPHRVSRAAGPNRERKDCKTGSTEANAAAAALAAAAAEKARNPAQELLVPELLALLHADRWGTAAAGPPIRPLRLTVGQPLVDAVYREPRKHKRRQKASVGAIDQWKNSGGKCAKVTLDIPKALQRDVRTHKRS